MLLHCVDRCITTCCCATGSQAAELQDVQQVTGAAVRGLEDTLLRIEKAAANAAAAVAAGSASTAVSAAGQGATGAKPVAGLDVARRPALGAGHAR